MSSKKYVVIPAGGRGVRLGSELPKQFLEINGKPVLRHTIEKFLSAFGDDISVIIVLPQDMKEYWRKYCASNCFIERYILVQGGITRFHSVQNALRYVKEDSIVAVHDGVRPLVSAGMIRRLFAEAESCPAVVPALPVVESLREISGDGSSVSVDRSRFVAVQTPQVFRSDVLKKAYGQAYLQSFTDDATVVQACGYPIRLVPGERTNIKITTREDLESAALLLGR
ncbi:MAG: 2-C-methyl-D-erythritol 4-phosphate cytidylyltransferase [Bacteroidales bacterium]|nr:2-C-methyl-D-erythritol 4-phosphate cytidylyltransferase [Candidatus Cacconaster scatequi]